MANYTFKGYKNQYSCNRHLVAMQQINNNFTFSVQEKVYVHTF